MKVLRSIRKGVGLALRFIGAGLMIVVNGIMNFIGYLIALICGS